MTKSTLLKLTKNQLVDKLLTLNADYQTLQNHYNTCNDDFKELSDSFYTFNASSDETITKLKNDIKFYKIFSIIITIVCAFFIVLNY